MLVIAQDALAATEVGAGPCPAREAIPPEEVSLAHTLFQLSCAGVQYVAKSASTEQTFPYDTVESGNFRHRRLGRRVE